MKRYVIHLSVYEVDEEGDTFPQETEGYTTDYATTNLDNILGRMDYFADMINDGLADCLDGEVVTSRRPLSEEWLELV